jgi:hypothetical protein
MVRRVGVCVRVDVHFGLFVESALKAKLAQIKVQVYGCIDEASSSSTESAAPRHSTPMQTRFGWTLSKFGKWLDSSFQSSASRGPPQASTHSLTNKVCLECMVVGGVGSRALLRVQLYSCAPYHTTRGEVKGVCLPYGHAR